MAHQHNIVQPLNDTPFLNRDTKSEWDGSKLELEAIIPKL